ncbi:MAG TPA: VOC family protein [Verrucomicrobiae bacterium]|nr:VOC family protein [Verrucomicrobiae bacterium]
MAQSTKSKIICFVATRQPAKAREFYEGTLELKFVSEDPFAIVFDVEGTMLRVQKVQELNPPKHTVTGWEVADIGGRMRELIGKGVRFERFPGLTQDESGAWTTPSGAKVAWFKDPDGNILSLTQFK